VIRDQGKGFDRTSLADPTDPENIMCITGRGILLMKSYCDAVSWNDKGNEVTLVKTLRG
jgi:anti-sigma regulatory factor (Ser/Thr protein kinase)